MVNEQRKSGKEGGRGETAEENRSAAKAQRSRTVASFYGPAHETWSRLREQNPGASDSTILNLVTRTMSDPRTIIERLYADFEAASRSSPALDDAERALVAWFGAIFRQLRLRTAEERRAAVIALPEAFARACPRDLF